MDTTPLTTTLRRALPASLLAVAALAPAAAQAAPTAGTPIPLGDGDAPKQLAVAADGTLWLTLDSIASDVARVKDGVVTKFDDAAVTGASGITIDGDGKIWITRQGGVSSFTAADPANMTETNIAAIGDPRKIVVGRDGNLHTASADKLVKIPPAAPATATTRTIPGLNATSIAATTSDLWVTNFGGEEIMRFGPAGNGEPITIPAGGNPQDIAAGAGGQVAIAMPSAPHRVSLRTAAGESAAPLVSGDPFGIAYGADQAYWTARFADHSVGRITATGEVTSLPMPAASGPRYIAAGSDTVWVGLETAKAVLAISGVTSPPAPTPTPAPVGTPDPASAAVPKITSVKLLRQRFRSGAKVASPTKGRAGVGTRVTVKTSTPATLRVVLNRLVVGRRSAAGACVAPGKAPSKAKRCLRPTTAYTLPQAGARSAHTVTITGRRPGTKRALRPGPYRLSVTAVDGAGKTSATVTRTLQITR